MRLLAKELIAKSEASLQKIREGLKVTPGFAHIWVGQDPQTAIFVRVKKRQAERLSCNYFLHDFAAADNRQLKALILGLNVRPDIHGIVLQLPLPKTNNVNELIETIAPEKDIDGLRVGSPFPAPTPSGIIALLEANDINPIDRRTVIIGAGRLVGMPLSKIFRERKWPFTHITQDAESQANVIREHDIVISCTGVNGLVKPAMVTGETIVIDGSGVDVDVKEIEPLVSAVTPSKGAVGPLTVQFLFQNLLEAATKISKG